MLTALLLTLSMDLIGPMENTNDVRHEITPQEIVNNIPEELLVQVVTKVLDDHPEIVVNTLKDHPEIVINILKDEKNSELIQEVLLDKITPILNNEEKGTEEEMKVPDGQLPPVPVDIDAEEKKEESNKEVTAMLEEDLKPEYSLYIYTTEGCGPCIRMMNEIIPRQYEFPGQVYVGKNPTTFRNGKSVTSFPAAEVVRDGVIVKRFVGYTPFDEILKVIQE